MVSPLPKFLHRSSSARLCSLFSDLFKNLRVTNGFMTAQREAADLLDRTVLGCPISICTPGCSSSKTEEQGQEKKSCLVGARTL